MLVLTAVLLVQCFAFADGGITALGANIFNMGIIGGAGGYYLYEGVRRLLPGDRGRLVAVAVASWVAVVVASIACAGELAFSGTVPWGTAFPAMAGVHMLIGVGEAIITTLVVFTIWQARPEVLAEPRGFEVLPKRQYGQFLIFGLLIALGLAIFVSPLASKFPDGLDKVADTLGFIGREASTRALPSPAPEYQLPGIGSAVVATSLAGLIGTLLVFGLAWVLARVLVPTRATVEPA